MLAVLHPALASAVCFYPGTWLSGYKIPLDVETRTTKEIVVGKVLAEKCLADASYPDHCTGYIYQFEVQRQLKGKVPGRIMLKTTNDSGGYRMSVGDQHLLFLERVGRYFEADICGNASMLPKGAGIVESVERLLARRAKTR
jgi:hypothetical protein